ncbi:T9SS type A sorting domain-containing protein [Flavobacterium sp.]|uniref:T9SS type A sorting domain-containing protein n=1 Tax=Flavobacterium sp. TaxID=239 RepID=UPI002608DDBA|nr:T9SS type A sorting domain-containing protein [Flavobacterium sp.]
MNKITLVSFLSIISIVSFAQNNLIEYKSRPKEFENFQTISDSVVALKTISEQVSSPSFQSKLPYPILFIHGLNSSSETWNTTTSYLNSQYSYTFGGRFDFCLNADSNNVTTNKNFYPTANADIIAFESSVQNGDYYYINFNVNPNGTVGTTVLSNQSAVAKQGAALKVAIQRVMEITGKNKVIIASHSMGGLASREYIQNSENWQSDNYHHVAKLLCIGTPHGGSNASDNALAFFTGTDLQSEAIRDLKSTYYYSGEAGRYLFGGSEIQDASNMNDNSNTPDFYNVDINCNGVLGESILGLNQKPIDNLIDFSCFIGRITNFFGTNITTDGIVAEPSSNLNHYYPTLTYPAKLFYYNSGYDLIENHTELTSYYYEIMQGLDEPNFKELAYWIDTNKIYFGFTTIQNPVSEDVDYFKFTTTESINATVSVSNIVTSSMNASILDASGVAVGAIQNNSGSNLNFNRTLSPGDYFLKISSTNPTNTNYQTPYQFTISTTLSENAVDVEALTFYPNPVEDVLHLDHFEIQKATIYNLSGQLITEKQFENQTTNTLDLSELESGMYLIKLKNNTEEKTIKIIKK